MDGTGKTHFALTAPGPIIYFDFDTGTEGVVEKFQTGAVEGQDGPKQVLKYAVRFSKVSATQEEWKKAWGDFRLRWQVAYELGEGTVILDTATEGYELSRLAEFGRLESVRGRNYGPISREWKDLIRLGYDSDMNTVLLHRLKPVWLNDVRTDKYEMAGYTGTSNEVQVSLVTHRQDVPGKYPVFSADVVKCRHKMELVGSKVMQGPLCTFEFLLTMVHGAAE